MTRCLYAWAGAAVKYAVYEDPRTHRFALVQLPSRFYDGDRVPVLPNERWFATKDEALGSVPDLFDRDDRVLVN